MIKIMLVEDDKSLREIYGVRLLAEGYDIVTAGDGEEALAMAIKERPQLIISDVMMPKISGFDMLDILRSTTETRNIKVIMMTALSSEEQRSRGEALGADRYLVKSQVGIEDVVRVVHEVLGDRPAGAVPQTQVAASAPAQPVAQQPTPPAPATPATNIPVQQPVAAQSQPTTTPRGVYGPPPSALPTPGYTPQQATAQQPATQSAAAPAPPRPATSTPQPPSLKSRVIQPLNPVNDQKIDLNDLLNKELNASAPPATFPSLNDEISALNDQVSNFEDQIAVDESGNLIQPGQGAQPAPTAQTSAQPTSSPPAAQPQDIPTPQSPPPTPQTTTPPTA